MNYEDYQRELDLQLERLKMVDRVLADPVKSLIYVYADWAKQGESPKYATMPSYITAEHRDQLPALLVHAMTCSTMQRVARQRHQHHWLKKQEKDLRSLNENVAKPFMPPSFDPEKPLDFIAAFDDHIFGSLNPVAATEIFRVLINSGESNAHSGTGLLMLFGIFWSLHRRHPKTTQVGARLDPWVPTASVTAKCLLLIRDLHQIIMLRQKLYGDMAASLKEIAANAGSATQHGRWRVVANLDRLAGTMHALSVVAINRQQFLNASHDVARLAKDAGPETPSGTLWRKAADRVHKVLLNLEETNREVLAETRRINDKVLAEIVTKAATDAGRAELGRHCRQFDVQHLHPDDRQKHWDDLQQAATRARDNANEALRALERGIEVCKPLHGDDGNEIAAFETVLKGLADTNEVVAEALEKAVQDNVDWILTLIPQHVAFASAGNLTHFDPAEMLSAIAVKERWSRDFTEAEAADAIKKAIDAGQREDGSFSATQPVFLEKRVHGVWPSTADIGWLLAIAARQKKEITTADEGLFRFVEWLERNRIDRPGDKPENPPRSGWSSDTREEDVIDTWATCSAINALLDIRAIVEHRLWQLCEKRFVVRTKEVLLPLDAIDPVDLGLIHKHRLHYRLATMARETAIQHEEQSSKEYAFMLHGPPGSSKTAIAEALGREMWGGKEPRFVRITPADFTRGGEQGLDREARFIFDLLSHVRRVTIFFDEIDDLLRSRAGGGDVSFLKLIVPAMLNRLQDLHDAAEAQEICFMLATNYIDNIEPALTRPGRIDAVIPVPYPDAWSREAIIERLFPGVTSEIKDVAVGASAGWPWSTYSKLCKRLKSMKALSASEVTTEMKEFENEFENSDSYYFTPDRWKRASRPLMKEFIRVAFALSKNRQVCHQKVDELLSELKQEQNDVQLKRLPFEETFSTEWSRTH
jgi:hypothetical protein